MRDDGTMKIILMAVGAYGLYWYINNYGPAGAVSLSGGPGSYWYSWFGAGASAPASTSSPASTSTPTSTSAGTLVSTPATVMGVTLQNTTRGGNSLQVGDKWQITITGAPNSPVVGSAQQNGNSLGSTNYGTTNSSGILVLTGTADPTTVGQWSEQWSVGGVQVGSISFTVIPAPSGTSGLGAIVPTTSVPGNTPSAPSSSRSWGSLASLASGGRVN